MFGLFKNCGDFGWKYNFSVNIDVFIKNDWVERNKKLRGRWKGKV